MYLYVSISNYAVEGINSITITIGSPSSSCSANVACNINTYCSSTPIYCSAAQVDSECFSTDVGGTIDVNIIEQNQQSITGIKTCPSSSPQDFYTADLTITTGVIFSPTPAPTPFVMSTFIGVKGAPFYAIAITAILLILYSVVIIRLRDSNDSLTHLRFSKVCFQLGLFGGNIASEFAYIGAVLQFTDSGLKAFASLILIARLCHLPGGLYILGKLMTSRDDIPNHYLLLTDKDHLLRNRSVYSILFIICFLDNTNIAFLPWLGSKVFYIIIITIYLNYYYLTLLIITTHSFHLILMAILTSSYTRFVLLSRSV